MSRGKRRRKRGMDRKKASCPKQRYMTDWLIGTKIDTRILACANGERRAGRTVVELRCAKLAHGHLKNNR